MKDFAYYSLRFPGALLGLCLIGVAFAPDIENMGGGTGDLIMRATILLVGVFILTPNHRFSTPILYRVRLLLLGLIGLGLIYFGIEMIFDYRAGGKDFAMIPIAAFILYNAIALPASAWLRKRVPEA